MSIVQNNQAFLDETGLNGQQAMIGLLFDRRVVGLRLCAAIWGWVVDRIGARRTAALSSSFGG